MVLSIISHINWLHFLLDKFYFICLHFYLIISIRKGREKYEIHGICRKIDELIEEEVTININGVVFTGFSTVCPYKIEEGKNYPVILDITVFDDIEINEGIDGVKNLKRIDNSFKYRISGILNPEFIDAGIIITDEGEIFRTQ